MTSLREAQKQMTRRLLLERALELFEAKGYAPTTIEDIAAAAGTTRTTFYMHFASKADLMLSLVGEVNEILTAPDDPPLPSVVQAGDRAQIRVYLARKFDQWPEIRAYIVSGNQAAAVDPDVQAAMDLWFDQTIEDMRLGLDRAGRFDPSARRVRCVLAFGELEFLSRRWMRHGWYVDRDTSLDVMTDSWCTLLTEGS
ncbi:TetR/AcrR family transcriptional regulator [Georgenia sp. SYP-B2076]|uniref:TetR/AcrR family transcriptional regulator n=1 Tax=Georgenia sp. SYP-B2076 TaxID=2495881 RepID=UPI000F8EA16D|nr:TetR/AcrR family transcriptional regulator [Georgenia sp. SYP-B2076]